MIWNEGGPGIPEPLSLALERQSVESVQSPDTAIAFAEMLALHAERAMQPILVIVEPTPGTRPAWPAAVGEMLEAMDAYLSETPIWLYSPIASPKLRALGTADRLRWTTPEVRIPLRAGGLRLVGDAGDAGESQPIAPAAKVEPVSPRRPEPMPQHREPKAADAADREPAGLLTPEEIDALMGDYPIDSGMDTGTDTGQGPARGQR